MPLNKSAFLRYRIIDSCLTNTMRRYPDAAYIVNKIEEQLGDTVSTSTFNKDIQQMKSIYNAPIKYDRKNAGYMYTEPDFSIREFPLTHEEIEALDLSTALLQQLKGTRMFQHFENAINKLIEGYRLSDILGNSNTQLIQVEEPIRVDSSQWLEPILKNIIEKNCLEILYQGFGRDERRHEVSAYLLKEYRNRWYLVGHSCEMDKVLIFALDRIKSITISNKQYQHNDFNSDDYFKYSFGITQMNSSEPEFVKLSFTPSQAHYIISQPLHHSQKLVSQTKEEVIFSYEVYNTIELRMTILSYGPSVKVLAPDHLVREIKTSIRQMLNKY